MLVLLNYIFITNKSNDIFYKNKKYNHRPISIISANIIIITCYKSCEPQIENTAEFIFSGVAISIKVTAGSYYSTLSIPLGYKQTRFVHFCIFFKQLYISKQNQKRLQRLQK